MELTLYTPSTGLKPTVHRVCMENEMQTNTSGGSGQKSSKCNMVAEHIKPIRKWGDEDEKIKAVVLVALKSKNTTEFNASVRIKTMLFLLRSWMEFYFSMVLLSSSLKRRLNKACDILKNFKSTSNTEPMKQKKGRFWVNFCWRSRHDKNKMIQENIFSYLLRK